VLIPAGGIVVVVLAMTWPMLGWPYPLWVRVSAEFHQQFTWAGLIAGTASCWYATVLHARDRIWNQPGAARLGGPAVTRNLTLLTGWFVGSYVLALVPLVVSTAVAGGVGTADPLAMLSGVVAMVAAVALGYALGTLMPSPAMVPIVAAGFYALLVAGNAGGERFAAVAPVLYFEPELGQRESLPLQLFRIAVFVAIGIAAVGLAARALYRRASGTAQPWRTIGDVATYLAVPVALIAVSLIRQPVVFTAAGEPTAACTDKRGIRYCVHPGNQPRLAALVDTVDPVIARYGTKPDNIDQIWDQALTFRPIDAHTADRLDVAWLHPDGTIQTDIASTVAGLYACSFAAPDVQERWTDDEREQITQVSADLTAYLSTGTPSGHFVSMPAPDIQRWIAQHQQRLQSCSLTPAEFPSRRS
jgi:hypothetical protein